MNEFTRTRFPKLRSAPPGQPLSPSIESLLKRTSFALSSEAVIELASTIEKDLLTGYRRLVAIDQEIGGVGLHNVNKRDEEYFTANYRIELECTLMTGHMRVHSNVGDDQQRQRQLRHGHIAEVIDYLAAKRARNHYICVLAQRFAKSLQETVDMLTKKLQDYEDFLEQWREAVFTACEQRGDEDPQYNEDADNHAKQLAEYTKKVIENIATTEAKMCG